MIFKTWDVVRIKPMGEFTWCDYFNQSIKGIVIETREIDGIKKVIVKNQGNFYACNSDELEYLYNMNDKERGIIDEGHSCGNG